LLNLLIVSCEDAIQNIKKTSPERSADAKSADLLDYLYEAFRHTASIYKEPSPAVLKK
jgi:hypothetical protein